MKATAEELALVNRLQSVPDDVTASATLFEKYYLLLIKVLKRGFKHVDDDQIYEIAFAALDKFVKNPQLFNPERSTLEYYLKMDAWGDLKNSYKHQSRQNNLMNSVEDWDSQWNMIEDAKDNQEEEEVLQMVYAKLEKIFPESLDCELAKMMLSGVRETSRYAVLLSVDHVDFKEQQAIVKRHKDRIAKVLDRSDWTNFTKNLKQRYL